MLKNFRYKLAYLIAPDLIEDLEYRIGAFLCHQTNGCHNNPYLSLEFMEGEADYARWLECEECEYHKAFCLKGIAGNSKLIEMRERLK